MPEVAALRRARQVLKEMHSEVDDDGLWEGFTTHLFKKLGISTPYYGKTMYILQQLGKVEKIRKGYAKTPSQWKVHEDVITDEEFATVYDKVKSNPDRRRLERRVTQLEQEVKDMRRVLQSQGLT